MENINEGIQSMMRLKCLRTLFETQYVVNKMIELNNMVVGGQQYAYFFQEIDLDQPVLMEKQNFIQNNANEEKLDFNLRYLKERFRCINRFIDCFETYVDQVFDIENQPLLQTQGKFLIPKDPESKQIADEQNFFLLSNKVTIIVKNISDSQGFDCSSHMRYQIYPFCPHKPDTYFEVTFRSYKAAFHQTRSMSMKFRFSNKDLDQKSIITEESSFDFLELRSHYQPLTKIQQKNWHNRKLTFENMKGEFIDSSPHFYFVMKSKENYFFKFFMKNDVAYAKTHFYQDDRPTKGAFKTLQEADSEKILGLTK